MITRRKFFAGAAIASTSIAFSSKSWASGGAVDATNHGLEPNSSVDQSSIFSKALQHATANGRQLFVPAGEYIVSDIRLESNANIIGVRGQTKLKNSQETSILYATDAQNILIENIEFIGSGVTSSADNFGLIDATNCEDVNIHSCGFTDAPMHGISLYGVSGSLHENTFSNQASAAIMSSNASDMSIMFNKIDGCGDNGILVWRSEMGHDGTIVSNNHIKNIDWRSGGNGQNGNGINVFRSGGVIVSNNVISDCAFSAVRANGTRNCQIVSNNCKNLSEVAIFSEFDFSGSIVAQNIIDEAAQGISITNWNDGGHLAICANNLVRNIWPSSPTNPDTVPVGISVEADIVVDGNVVEKVPGSGISVGWGPYMRNIVVTDNIVRDVNLGINVTLAEGAGAAQISDNLIDEAKTAAIVGSAWDDIVETDLQAAADKYPLVSVSNNKY